MNGATALAENLTYIPPPFATPRSETVGVFSSEDITSSRRDWEGVPVDYVQRGALRKGHDQPTPILNFLVLEGQPIGQTSDGRPLVARQRFRVGVENLGDGFLVVLQADHSRVGSGKSFLEAWRDFGESLAEDYEFYASTEDTELTGDAQGYKRLLQELLAKM